MFITKEAQKYWDEIRELNFDEVKGSSYWVEKAKENNVRPRDLESLEDFLTHPISLCDEEDLRKPIEYFIPKEVLKEKNYIPMTSSGSKGKKKTVPWSKEAITENGRHLAKVLRLYGVKDGINYLLAGPSDPAPFKYIVDSLVENMKGTLFFAPIETRGLKKIFAENQKIALAMSEAKNVEELSRIISQDNFLQERFGPCLEYTDDILSREKIEFFGTMIYWLNAFENHKGFENVKYVYIGGMEIPVEFYNFWKERLKREGRELITSYGHYRFGLLFDLRNQPLTYYPFEPFNFLFVTQEENPFELVKYGERGRVRFLSLDKAMLWCQVERDYAERVRGNEYFDWDGVKEIKPKF